MKRGSKSSLQFIRSSSCLDRFAHVGRVRVVTDIQVSRFHRWVSTMSGSQPNVVSPSKNISHDWARTRTKHFNNVQFWCRWNLIINSVTLWVQARHQIPASMTSTTECSKLRVTNAGEVPSASHANQLATNIECHFSVGFSLYCQTSQGPQRTFLAGHHFHGVAPDQLNLSRPRALAVRRVAIDARNRIPNHTPVLFQSRGSHHTMHRTCSALSSVNSIRVQRKVTSLV